MDHDQARNETWSRIHTLPGEILSEILTVATLSHEHDKKRYRFPSVLCQVSHLWRTVTLSTPKIWAFILITQAYTLQHVQVRLTRSKGVPLDVKIRDEIWDLEPHEVMKDILPACDRWITLTFVVDDLRPYVKLFPKSLPRLHSIYLYNADPTSFILDCTLPKITCMTMQSTCLCWPSSALFASLIEFHALSRVNCRSETFENLIVFLGNMPNLEVLELTESWNLESLKEGEYASLKRLGIMLPRLRMMRIDSLVVWRFLVLASLIHTPAVQTIRLNITYNFRQEGYIPPNDQLRLRFPSLKKLILEDWYLGEEDSQWILSQLLPEIQELSIVGVSGSAKILEMIISTPSLAGLTSKLSKMATKDISIATLHRVLSNYTNTTPGGSPSLNCRLSLRVYSRDLRCTSTGADSRADLREHERVLAELKGLVFHLEATEEEQWWGYGNWESFNRS